MRSLLTEQVVRFLVLDVDDALEQRTLSGQCQRDGRLFDIVAHEREVAGQDDMLGQLAEVHSSEPNRTERTTLA